VRACGTGHQSHDAERGQSATQPQDERERPNELDDDRERGERGGEA
jgi:hypothetical protein